MIDEWLKRIDDELAEYKADRDAHPADPSIEGLITVGKLDPAVREAMRRG